MTVTLSDPPPPLLEAEKVPSFDAFERLVRRLHARRSTVAGGLWGSSQALVLATLATRAQGPWLVVCSNEIEGDLFAEDLRSFGAEVATMPARDPFAKRGAAQVDVEAVRLRLQVAQRLSGPPERRPRMIVASVLSLLQPLPDAAELEREFLGLQAHQGLDVNKLLDRLVESGYTRQPLVESPGEISLRGDILDVFPFASDLPLRIELFDDEIESLRSFDPDTQRSVETFPQVRICLANDAGGVEDGDGVLPHALLAPTATFVEIEPLRIQDASEGLRIQSSSHQRALMQWRKSLDEHRRLQLQSLPGADVDFDARTVQAFSGGLREASRRLVAAVRGVPGAAGVPPPPGGGGHATAALRAVVACTTPAEQERYRTVLKEIDAEAEIDVTVGTLAKGFHLPAAGLVVVHHRELAGVVGARNQQRAKPAHKSRALQSFFELKRGDLVVHAVHGLARFRGLELMRRGGGEEEHLELAFADDVKLFVPACRIDLVQRYIGSGAAAAKLDKIGGQSFRRRKEKVERALRDLAADMLEVQAKRDMATRDPWTGDDALVESMVAEFPYTDTEDQAKADAEIRADLSGPRPLDRLLCGDVGFGKTEVALRAAFRVVNGGGQVAVLVPTTVLAQQHHRTFAARLADFPVEVAGLSRHVPPGKQKKAIEGLASGAVDVVVGTHRILSKDVKFKNLGLVIVDEEQRFGVTHKEHFKRLRATIDVLSLSATPIPRTLHMSIAGLRDISALTMPPPGRQEIETVLTTIQDENQVRQALLREKQRGGQVFVLHNRVHSIEEVARWLQELVPECTYAIGHGQMGARELDRVMTAFIRGDVDVLVATTIVENGIDIPSAGTILIHEADRFGLSELHQLRGRVGRGAHKAYCYLLVDKYKPIRQIARERLQALVEMNQLGAGFGISMKDLEIRGAGNILGPEQSGHIAAIGYDMYCRLLKSTVERLRAGGSDAAPEDAVDPVAGVELELGLRAFLPHDWVPSQETRIEILRELDDVHTTEEAAQAADSLRDRYGRLPPEAAQLVRTFRLRGTLAALGVRRLAWREDTYLLEFEDRVQLEGALLRPGVEFRPLRAGQGLLVVPRDRRDPESALDWIEGLLSGARPQ